MHSLRTSCARGVGGTRTSTEYSEMLQLGVALNLLFQMVAMDRWRVLKRATSEPMKASATPYCHNVRACQDAGLGMLLPSKLSPRSNNFLSASLSQNPNVKRLLSDMTFFSANIVPLRVSVKYRACQLHEAL